MASHSSMGQTSGKPVPQAHGQWVQKGVALPVRDIVQRMAFEDFAVTTKDVPSRDVSRDSEGLLHHSKPSPYEKLNIDCRAVVDAALAAAAASRAQQSLLGPAVMERIVGSMLGMAVGDSVGAPLEFIPIGAEGHHYDARNRTYTGEQNAFQLERGQWTDDSAMGLCIADSLLAKRCVHTMLGQRSAMCTGLKTLQGPRVTALGSVNFMPRLPESLFWGHLLPSWLGVGVGCCAGARLWARLWVIRSGCGRGPAVRPSSTGQMLMGGCPSWQDEQGVITRMPR